MVNPERAVYIHIQSLLANRLGIENPVLNRLYQAEQYQAEHSNIVGDEWRVSPLLPVAACVNRSPHA